MAGPLPESYTRLAAYAQRFPAGAALYEQGAHLDRFYVVLRGRVDFEAVSESGTAAVVASAGPGEVAGHVAAFADRVTSASAHTAADSVLLVVPVDRAVELFCEAPELALLLIRTLADPERASAAARIEDAASPEPVIPGSAALVRAPGEVDERQLLPGHDGLPRRQN